MTASPTTQRTPHIPSRVGYYGLAERMKIADGEVAIFRNFKSLNLLNLLRLQSEILTLELKIDGDRHFDDASSEKINLNEGRPNTSPLLVSRGDLSKAFWYMKQASDMDPMENGQYLNLIDLGDKLKEYNELLVQFAQLNKIAKPTESELALLLDWLNDHSFIPVGTPERNPYDRGPDEYVCLTPEDNETNVIPKPIFTLYDKYIQRTMPFLKNRGRADPEHVADGLAQFDEIHYTKKAVIKVGNWLVPIISSLLIIAAIIILYFIPTTLARLFITMPLTVLFSLAVSGLTSASRADVVAAVAAFVAVEVVFVGSVAPE